MKQHKLEMKILYRKFFESGLYKWAHFILIIGILIGMGFTEKYPNLVWYILILCSFGLNVMLSFLKYMSFKK